MVTFISLIIIKYLICILEDGINDSDLPASICYVRTCAHECRSTQYVNAGSVIHNDALPEYYSQISGIHSVRC